MYKGSITALITPFKDGAVDGDALQQFVEWQIAQGTHGLVPAGTTGESPTLTPAEHQRVVELCVEAAAGRVPVLAGAGSNATAEAVGFTRHAAQAKADGVLHVTPYYNKPTQAGLVAHFEAISRASTLPIFIYNIPSRCVVDMTPETMGQLAKLDNIIGVKDATADLARVKQQAASCGADFIQLSGEDATAVAFIKQGGVGCISVVSNVMPRLCADMQNAANAGDFATAESILARLMPLITLLFAESSPAPIKYVAARLGKCNGEIRLPLVPASAALQTRLNAAMDALEL